MCGWSGIEAHFRLGWSLALPGHEFARAGIATVRLRGVSVPQSHTVIWN